jgi:outer membrane protein assembly factor BamD (BamD/ComL family)
LRRKMRSIRYTITAVFFLFLCQFSLTAFGQMGFSFDLKKPKEYEERTLRSEKSDQKKFTLPRRFVQNTVTHYNYFYNANLKLNEVLTRAKSGFIDDYSTLLPFYNYSLDVTAGDSLQIDSISYKSQAGIALHDLRNDWADNLYLLWGAAYYLRKDFDSAYLMFQFINYAFADKEKDGYYKVIGSKMDGNSAYSISTKEKSSLTKKIFSEPPSRNDAFIWQIRNHLAQDQYAEAASLIITLRNDPVFPKRLMNDLEEVQAYWFYKQEMWDSSAAHLIGALSNATNQQERARWEFLLAQLYERTGKFKESEKYFNKAITHTTDPIMDIYARLYTIRVNKDGGDNYIEKNISELLKMGKRDKYEDYRDIIYYMAAQMELERNNPDAAIALLMKSTQYRTSTPAQRNRAFLQLAELNFKKKKYRLAYNYYDSLRIDDPDLKDPEAITARKEALGRIANSIEIIARQDSLQALANMPEDQRKDIVKKLVRQLRRAQGLKDENTGGGGFTSGFPTNANNPAPLFPANTTGEWYFYNTNSRGKGATDFQSRWGKRPNADNWRRSAALVGNINRPADPSKTTTTLTTAGTDADITFDGLYGRLPLTPELMIVSHDSIQRAMYLLGQGYIQDIEDCASGTETLELLRTKYPSYNPMDELLFNLYYCYSRNGEKAKADAIRKLMSDKYGSSNFTTIVTTGKNPLVTKGNTDATRTYEHIYDLFIEGKFDEAVAQKKAADAQYSNNYWTPQLLYIEAVYYVRQRDDSTAIRSLQNIISQFPGTPLSAKSSNLISVLKRRAQIEDELTRMVINRPPEDSVRSEQPVLITRPPVTKQQDTLKVNKPVVSVPVTNIKTPVDTLKVKPPSNPASFFYAPASPHYVVLLLNKVDPVYVNEAKNAFTRYNKDTYYNKQFTVDLSPLDDDNRLLLISPFNNADEALVYVENTRPKTATQIVPWLKGGKYTFYIIDEANLRLLKENKNLEGYKTFLNQHLPGKF